MRTSTLSGRAPADRPRPAIEARSSTCWPRGAEFRGCSFQAADTASRLPVAVRWTHPADRNAAEMSLFTGQLQLSDCVLRRVSAGVACETLGALSVEMANVLSVDSGPAIELDHCPEGGRAGADRASNVTLRNTGPLLECRYGPIPDRPGNISIQASACALATRPDAGLLSFIGTGRPDRILSEIAWNGQGSLVLPEAVIAVWRSPEGRRPGIGRRLGVDRRAGAERGGILRSGRLRLGIEPARPMAGAPAVVESPGHRSGPARLAGAGAADVEPLLACRRRGWGLALVPGCGWLMS